MFICTLAKSWHLVTLPLAGIQVCDLHLILKSLGLCLLNTLEGYCFTPDCCQAALLNILDQHEASLISTLQTDSP